MLKNDDGLVPATDLPGRHASMVAKQAMTGANGLTVRALPHGQLVDLLRRTGRM